MKPNLKVVQDTDNCAVPSNLNGDPIIEPGIYSVVVVAAAEKPFRLQDRWRLAIRVKVTNGDFAGAVLQRIYSVGRSDDGELFVPAGKSSSLRRESLAILKRPTTDLSPMVGESLLARVHTTTTDSDGDPIPADLQYSHVRKLWPSEQSIQRLLQGDKHE